MKNYPKSLQDLIECYKKLPSIGEKTAERLALSTLQMDDKTIKLFQESLKNIKEKIKECKICNNYTENDICEICASKKRTYY